MYAGFPIPRFRRGIIVCGLMTAGLYALMTAVPVSGCPFCPRTETLSDQIFRIDASVIVRRVGGTEGKDGKPGTTTVRVERVLHISTELAKRHAGNGESSTTPKIPLPVEGAEIVIDRYYAPQEDTLYLLRGADPESFRWGDNLIEVSPALIDYVLAAPSVDAPSLKRGGYYLQYLEADDPQIAQDAYAEFAMMPYADVAQFRDRLPREKLRRWIFDKQIPGTRLGLYGLMLGLCGDKSDAKLLEKKILKRESDIRLGVDGVMGGYLLLTGEKGMDLIEREILRKKDIPDGELLAAMQAIRFLWTYGDGRVSRERLKSSMRLMIDRPQVMDSAIRDLARWRDWTQMDRIVALYGAPEYDDLQVRLGIVKFLIAAVRDKPPKGETAQPEVKEAALKHIEALREKDPKNVQRAERFFDLNY